MNAGCSSHASATGRRCPAPKTAVWRNEFDHEITPAQENEQKRTGMPAAIPGRVRIRNTDSLTPACPPLHDDSSGIKRIPAIMNRRTPPDPLVTILAQSEGVMTRVRMINATLRQLRIDCTELDTLAGNGTVQLATAQAMLRVGNLAGTRPALARFRDTVNLLRDAYRVVLVREDLPGETAQGVLSIAQSLDVTAVQAMMA
jgi:hypothetical protein